MTHTPEQSRRPSPAIGAAVVLLACVAAYLTSFSGAFVYDDLNQILNNPDLLPGSTLGQILASTPRPVTSLTFAINLASYPGASIANQPPTFAFHFVNLLIHTASALFLLGILRRASKGAHPLLPLAGALLWAIHPLQTQSVTYLVQRAESLMGMLALASVYLLFRADTAPKGLLKNLATAGVFLCCALSMGAKAVAIVLPVAVLLIDRATIAGSFAAALRSRKLMYLGLLLSMGVPFLTGIGQGVLDTGSNPNAAVGFAYEGISPSAYFISQPAVILHYLRLIFFPVGQCIDYDWPAAPSLLSALPALAVVSLLGGVALFGIIKNTKWGLCLVLFFLLLAPTSSIIPIKDLAYEHRMYLPLAPIVVVVLLGVYRLVPILRIPRAAITGLALVALALAATTAARNTIYHSDESIWRDVLAKGGNEPRALVNLASIHNRAQDFEPAIESARRALELDPKSTEASGLLAQSLLESGDAQAAAAQFEAYLDQRPQDAPVRFNYAQSLLASDRPADAVEQLDLLLRATPTDDEAVASLDAIAQRAYQAENAELALRTYTLLTVHRPTNATNWCNLGLTLGRTDNFPAAIENFERALLLDPTNQRAKVALDIAKQQLNQPR